MESSPSWQPARKWEPQSYNLQENIWNNLRETGSISFPSQATDEAVTPVSPGLLPDENLKQKAQLSYGLSDLQKLENDKSLLF